MVDFLSWNDVVKPIIMNLWTMSKCLRNETLFCKSVKYVLTETFIFKTFWTIKISFNLLNGPFPVSFFVYFLVFSKRKYHLSNKLFWKNSSSILRDSSSHFLPKIYSDFLHDQAKWLPSQMKRIGGRRNWRTKKERPTIEGERAFTNRKSVSPY